MSWLTFTSTIPFCCASGHSKASFPDLEEARSGTRRSARLRLQGIGRSPRIATGEHPVRQEGPRIEFRGRRLGSVENVAICLVNLPGGSADIEHFPNQFTAQPGHGAI